MHGKLPQWTRDITHVLAQPPGTPQLQALTDWLGRLGLVDHFVLFVYEGRYLPLPLFDTVPPHLRPLFVEEYQAGAYRLDPFFLACEGGEVEGLHSLERLAPAGFAGSEYVQGYYRRLGLGEELGFFTQLEGRGRAVLSLMRRRGRGDYSRRQRRLLRSAVPVVDEVVRSAWMRHLRQEPQVAYELDRRVCEAIERFGEGLLSPRERQVARLVLKGYASSAIAELLAITPGTVKVHRKNLYDKLGIGSQSELFGLFVRGLRRGAGSSGTR
ncbi:helix-turn-helix transcriptional regulator [Metapseudomonas furukawaii]